MLEKINFQTFAGPDSPDHVILVGDWVDDDGVLELVQSGGQLPRARLLHAGRVACTVMLKIFLPTAHKYF